MRQSGVVYSHEETPEGAMGDLATKQLLAWRRKAVSRGRALFAASATRGAATSTLLPPPVSHVTEFTRLRRRKDDVRLGAVNVFSIRTEARTVSESDIYCASSKGRESIHDVP